MSQVDRVLQNTETPGKLITLGKEEHPKQISSQPISHLCSTRGISHYERQKKGGTMHEGRVKAEGREEGRQGTREARAQNFNHVIRIRMMRL